MTIPQDEGPPTNDDRPKRRLRWVGLGFAVFVALVAGAGAWGLGLFTPEPEEATLEAAIAAQETTIPKATQETTQAPDAQEPDGDEPPSTTTTTAQPIEPNAESTASLAGTWTVIPNDATFVGYRAAGHVGGTVGRSPGVTGSLQATDTQVTTVEIVADMTQLTSDSELRDEHLGDQGFEHNTYPTSMFVLTKPIDIPSIPDDTTPLAFTAVGNLTVRDITQPVAIELEAAVVNNQLIVVGATEIELDDFGASITGTSEATIEFSIVFAP